MTVKQLLNGLSRERFDIKGVDIEVRFANGQTWPITGLELDTANKKAYLDIEAEFRRHTPNPPEDGPMITEG